MNTFLQITLGGVSIGAIYALLALVWVVVFRVSRVLFLVAGEFVVISALTTFHLSQQGTPVWIAAVVGIAACVATALIIDGVLRLVPRMRHLAVVLLMIGLTYFIAHLAAAIFGSAPEVLPAFLPRDPLQFAGLTVTPHQVLLVGTTALICVLLAVFVRHTMLGKALSACSEEPDGARIVGIDPIAMRTVSFAIAAVIGGIAGVLLIPIYSIDPYAGLGYALIGFTAAVLGGWGFATAGVAGLVLGLLTNYVAGYFSSAYQEVVTFGLLVLILVAATLKRSPRFLAELLRE